MEFRNRSSLFLWGFAAVWLSMLIAFTLVAIRDGPPEGHSAATIAVILGIFWVAGAAIVNFAMTKPCYSVAITPEADLTLIWTYPYKRIKKKFAGDGIVAPAVVEEKDSEGDPYYIARLSLPDGSTFDIAENHDRARCDRVCKKFTEALSRSGGEHKSA